MKMVWAKNSSPSVKQSPAYFLSPFNSQVDLCSHYCRPRCLIKACLAPLASPRGSVKYPLQRTLSISAPSPYASAGSFAFLIGQRMPESLHPVACQRPTFLSFSHILGRVLLSFLAAQQLHFLMCLSRFKLSSFFTWVNSHDWLLPLRRQLLRKIFNSLWLVTAG